MLIKYEGAANDQLVTEELAAEREVVTEQQMQEPAQPELTCYDTPEQRAERASEIDLTGLSVPERVAKVLELFPGLSDRELGKLSGMAAATAKKYRETLRTQTTKEDGQ